MKPEPYTLTGIIDSVDAVDLKRAQKITYSVGKGKVPFPSHPWTSLEDLIALEFVAVRRETAERCADLFDKIAESCERDAKFWGPGQRATGQAYDQAMKARQNADMIRRKFNLDAPAAKAHAEVDGEVGGLDRRRNR